MLIGAGIYAIGAACGALLAVQLGERLHQLRRQLAGKDRLRPAIELHVQILGDRDLQFTAFELDDQRALGAAEEGGDGGAAGTGAGGERLPHPALEDAGADPAAVDREEGDVGPVREELVPFDSRPDLSQVELVELLLDDDDRALRVADRDVLELPAAPAGLKRAAAVLAPGGEVLRSGRGATHVDRAGQLAGDGWPDRPGGGADRELVLIRPAVAAEVEDRLAGAVAGELGLGTVRVEDPQIGNKLRVLAA